MRALGLKQQKVKPNVSIFIQVFSSFKNGFQLKATYIIIENDQLRRNHDYVTKSVLVVKKKIKIENYTDIFMNNCFGVNCTRKFYYSLTTCQ